MRVLRGTPRRGRPRKYFPDRPATQAEIMQSRRSEQRKLKLENVAVLDFETDPFDDLKQTPVYPFTACLYSRNFDPVVIWNENYEEFIAELWQVIEELPEDYTIYAHNGGKFDYMFFIHKLRGSVSFKGRGIMSASIHTKSGHKHELRDSFHLIPEKLAAYAKDDFDYSWMLKEKRNKHRDAIIKYMVSDCKYLLDIVTGFLEDFGFKLSIGQAAMAELKKHYKVKRIGEHTDEWLRSYFFGGRVECLAGRGHFMGNYKLYDVNSMYPYVMANFAHPVGNNYSRRRSGSVDENTIFIELECTNHGALVRRNDNNDTSAQEKEGVFFTTVWEYEAALDLGLIENVNIIGMIDCDMRSDFSKFILPLYAKRQLTKKALGKLKRNGITDGEEYLTVKKDDLFLKLLMNNAYGKFAQNPRRYKDHYITEPFAPPPAGFEDYRPQYECPEYWIWQKPAPATRFNNVGTAASITGAARAVLMRAIHGATDAIYCDTDSLICKDIGANTFIHNEELGAWDLEDEFVEIIINGKKTYACKKAKTLDKSDVFKIRSKGVPEGRLGWGEMLRILHGETIAVPAKAPTITKTGRQVYITRNIRATAPIKEHV